MSLIDVKDYKDCVTVSRDEDQLYVRFAPETVITLPMEVVRTKENIPELVADSVWEFVDIQWLADYKKLMIDKIATVLK